MSELPTRDLLDTMPLEDLTIVVHKLDVADQSTIHIIRRWLMRKTEVNLTPEKIATLRQNIVVPTEEIIAGQYSTSNFDSVKFAREGNRLIHFPDDDRDMHIHYAIAGGMKIPDDAGLISFLEPNQLEIEGDSSSLHIPQSNNTARPRTIELYQEIIPPNIELKAVVK